MVALQEVKERAQAAGDTQSIEAAKAVEKRVQKVEITEQLLIIGELVLLTSFCASLRRCRGVNLNPLQAETGFCLQVGSNYFRIHPKGVGLMCNRAEGLPPLTFVEEYLGEVHTPWRWFEMQVAP